MWFGTVHDTTSTSSSCHVLPARTARTGRESIPAVADDLSPDFCAALREAFERAGYHADGVLRL
ncbi:hypothetical protein ACFQ1S_45110, partial [Kibdelosporangium lantanae]